jgi:hypothetical protein
MTADESKEDITSGHHQNNNLEVVALRIVGKENILWYQMKGASFCTFIWRIGLNRIG